ncbi:MAG: N,N-dimethylformamidase large subunit, partial [Alphaproteobacteria bacterium]
MIPIVGYADRLTAAPGETIAFKISSAGDKPYRARLVRLISGDPNPESPGIQEADIPSDFEGEYPGRMQTVDLGSYIRVPNGRPLDGLASYTLSATIWPTTPDKPDQGVIARLDARAGAGFALAIGPEGAEARLGLGGEVAVVKVGKALVGRRWHRVWCGYD